MRHRGELRKLARLGLQECKRTSKIENNRAELDNQQSARGIRKDYAVSKDEAKY